MNAQRDDETALDALRDRLYDAIETAMWAHESKDRDSRCTCGVRNNMDGDVLHGHRVGAVADAAWSVVEALGLTPELLHLNEYAAANGAEPEIQRRWVTKWEQQA